MLQIAPTSWSAYGYGLNFDESHEFSKYWMLWIVIIDSDISPNRSEAINWTLMAKFYLAWPCLVTLLWCLNTLRPRQHGRHFADDIFKCIFLNENVWIPIKISLKFVLKDPINNIPALVRIMAWRRPGDKLLSEQMVVSLPTHICVTRPQWVNRCRKIWLVTSSRFCISFFISNDFLLCNNTCLHQVFLCYHIP